MTQLSYLASWPKDIKQGKLHSRIYSILKPKWHYLQLLLFFNIAKGQARSITMFTDTPRPQNIPLKPNHDGFYIISKYELEMRVLSSWDVALMTILG